MGGAPLLLALAAVTVDYGWQPDDKGGIEYIIQIPPGQLEQSGGFTSRIDPRVRGLVSRVVIRVGDGPLPQDFGDIAPNTAPESLTIIPEQDRQVTETQVRQADGETTVVRGQNGSQTSGGFAMPVQATSGTGTQSAGSGSRNVGNTMPTTNFNPNTFNANAQSTTNSGQAGQNFRGVANDNARGNMGQQTANNTNNDPRNFASSQQNNTANNPSAQNNNGTSGYRDSSWTSNPTQSRGPMPSTSPYASVNQSNNGTSQTNNASNGGFNSEIFDRNNPNAGPAFPSDNSGRSPLSTFANPNTNMGQSNNGYNLLTNSSNQNGLQSNNQTTWPDTNLQSVYANGQQQNQAGFNQQQGNMQQGNAQQGNAQQGNAQQPGFANQPNYGPMRDAYGTGNNQNFAGNSNTPSQFANSAMQGNTAGNGGFANNPYNYPSVNPNFNYTQPSNNFTVPQFPSGGYNPALADPRYAMANGNPFAQFNGSDRTGKDDVSDKASAILIAERERLSTQALELQRENETLAKAKEALLYDNNTLIAENRVTKDRLQSMSFFQFFLMVSFLANLYLIVHLSKLYQRYRDLVTTVRASSASAQPV